MFTKVIGSLENDYRKSISWNTLGRRERGGEDRVGGLFNGLIIGCI